MILLAPPRQISRSLSLSPLLVLEKLQNWTTPTANISPRSTVFVLRTFRHYSPLYSSYYYHSARRVYIISGLRSRIIPASANQSGADKAGQPCCPLSPHTFCRHRKLSCIDRQAGFKLHRGVPTSLSTTALQLINTSTSPPSQHPPANAKRKIKDKKSVARLLRMTCTTFLSRAAVQLICLTYLSPATNRQDRPGVISPGSSSL